MMSWTTPPTPTAGGALKKYENAWTTHRAGGAYQLLGQHIQIFIYFLNLTDKAFILKIP